MRDRLAVYETSGLQSDRGSLDLRRETIADRAAQSGGGADRLGIRPPPRRAKGRAGPSTAWSR